MTEHFEAKVRERAYHLWQKEGSPPGRDAEFWERARLMEEAEAKPLPSTPLQARSAEEAAIDEALAETFPASDPASTTPAVSVGEQTSAAVTGKTKARPPKRR